MADPTIADVMASLTALHHDVATIKTQNLQQTGLLVSLVQGAQLMAEDLTSLSAKVDAATTAIGVSLAANSAKLDSEGAVITGIAALIQSLKDQIAASGVPQAVLDQMQASVDRLTGVAASIDTETTAIDTHVASLTAMNPSVPSTLQVAAPGMPTVRTP